MKSITQRVYIKNSGLASYVMGPWNNPNLPKNQGASSPVYRFPRTPVIPVSKTLTGLGAIGFLVDGVSIYNTSDGFSYSVSHAQDATPTAGIGQGDGIWNRDAWVLEFGSFDYAYAHNPQSGQYHAHADPIAVRYLLGDNVNYNSSTKVYSENTNTVTFAHSPIIGWLNDGIPLYGPYGYSNAMDATSPVSHGFGLHPPGRQLPHKQLECNRPYDASRVGRRRSGPSATLSSGQYGPSTTYTSGTGMNFLTYTLGHYAEDYDYLGDLGYTQGSTSNVGGVFFDLNKYNARYCVTPEYPNGTWAYFVTLQTNSTPWYPYNVGRWYMGSPTAGTTSVATMNADTPLTQYFLGATNLHEQATGISANASNGNVTVTWSAVEGGTYQVSASNDLSTWTNLTPTVTATENTASNVEAGAASSTPQRFYKTIRTGLATFDLNGY